MSSLKTAILIPAFNEDENIYKVVVQSQKFGHVIVINDGSTDATSIAAEKGGASVINHSCNLGYEAALNSGFQAALDQGFDYAITLDADGQHNPAIIAEFISHLDKGSDLVLGRRSSLQRWSEGVFAFVGRSLWGVSDPLCGMKAYRLSSVKIPAIFDTRKLIGTELMLKMIKNLSKMQRIK